MRPEMREKLLKLLKGEEKYKQFAYPDTKGILTIGFGRNLQTKGVNLDEALYLLTNDVQEAEMQIWKDYPEYSHLSEARKAALVDMTFNLGIGGVLAFKKMFAAIAIEDWATASKEILNSQYHEDVGHRAEVWANVMETGVL